MTNLRDTAAKEQVPASCAKFSHSDINTINELRTHYAREVTSLERKKGSECLKDVRIPFYFGASESEVAIISEKKKPRALRNFEALRISSKKLFRRQERELTFDPISNFKVPDHSFSSTLYSSSWFGISRINWPGYVM